MQKPQGRNECGDSEAMWLEWKEGGYMVAAEKGKADRPGPSGIPEGQAEEAAFWSKSKAKPWEGFKPVEGEGNKIHIAGKLLDLEFGLPDACLNFPCSL